MLVLAMEFSRGWDHILLGWWTDTSGPELI